MFTGVINDTKSSQFNREEEIRRVESELKEELIRLCGLIYQ